jgi:predicted TPR repeat methyltransferase
MTLKAVSTDYRERVYRRYSSARERILAPDTLDGFRPRVPFLNRIIRNHFPRDRSAAILDLGCGHGALVHLARQAGYRNIRGVDVAPEQVAAAKRLGIDEVVQKDLMETLRSLADEAQDCIVAFDEDGRQHQG